MTDEQTAAQESIRAWARSSKPIDTVREDAAGGWQLHWPQLAALGLFSVAVDEDRAGAGGDVVDLAAMLEQASTESAPGPLLGTAVAALVLGRFQPAGPDVPLTDILEGRLACAVAAPGVEPLTAVPHPDGGLVISGELAEVLGADDGVALLVPVATDTGRCWCLIDADAPGVHIEALSGLDRATPLATVRCEDVSVTAGRICTGLRDGLVDELSLTVGAVIAAGIAGWCVATAVDYAKVREQFGKPIGAFQAVKHLCAEMLCRAEQARAAAWDAAVAVDNAPTDDPGQLAIAAAVAGALALDAAVDNAKACIQVLGGIGYTWEHDAHFYLRRAVALRQMLGGSALWRRRTWELTRDETRRQLSVDLGDVEPQRAEIRRDVDKLVAVAPEQQRVALADSGLLAPHWPKPYGRAAAPAQQLLIDQELAHAGITRPDLVIGWWALPPILEAGTPEQIERYVRPTLRGELRWCQLFSEPGAGSDLASLQMRAERVDGGWRLTGQKVWNSLANVADWGICLARTDRQAPKHKGITYFLIDMQSEGIDVRPLREITGDALFNEVFFDNVFVPDVCVVGELNSGWKLARTTLANERVQMSGGSSLGTKMEQVIARAAGHEDPLVADQVGALIAQATTVSLLAHRSTLRQLDGRGPGPESSVQKIVGVRNRQACAEYAVELAGRHGAVEDEYTREFLNTRCLSIAGGTEQILLSLVGERILGLPRG